MNTYNIKVYPVYPFTFILSVTWFNPDLTYPSFLKQFNLHFYRAVTSHCKQTINEFPPPLTAVLSGSVKLVLMKTLNGASCQTANQFTIPFPSCIFFFFAEVSCFIICFLLSVFVLSVFIVVYRTFNLPGPLKELSRRYGAVIEAIKRFRSWTATGPPSKRAGAGVRFSQATIQRDTRNAITHLHPGYVHTILQMQTRKQTWNVHKCPSLLERHMSHSISIHQTLQWPLVTRVEASAFAVLLHSFVQVSL